MRLVVARVGRAHGIRGEVTVEVRTDSPQERFRPGAQLYVVPSRRPGPGPTLPAVLTVASARDHSGTLLLTFDEVPDRNMAEDLRGVLLEAEIPQDVQEQDAWYDHQLVGLRVEDPDGVPIGRVTSVEHGVQDLLVLRTEAGAERLVPFVGALVPVVDLEQGRVVVDAPPGLLDDGAP
jgi:16S rRNA processing protein RimM